MLEDCLLPRPLPLAEEEDTGEGGKAEEEETVPPQHKETSRTSPRIRYEALVLEEQLLALPMESLADRHRLEEERQTLAEDAQKKAGEEASDRVEDHERQLVHR